MKEGGRKSEKHKGPSRHPCGTPLRDDHDASLSASYTRWHPHKSVPSSCSPPLPPPHPPTWATTQTKTAATHRDAAESRRLLAKPLQEPLPQRDAYHSRNLRKQARAAASLSKRVTFQWRIHDEWLRVEEKWLQRRKRKL